MPFSNLVRTVPLLLALLLSSSAFATETQPCQVSAADQTQIIDTVNSMFSAAQTDDLTKFHNIADPTFYAYDNGKRFDGDALLNLIRDYHTKGYVFVWTVNDPQVHIDCNLAWVTYVNRGSITDPSHTTTPMQWLESVILEKESGNWRILFVHSTRVPPPPAPK
jgi:hypothetical protein